jgi:poly(A)-specific ribonuclease
MQELGFSLIVGYMMESKKPLIGHNMIYDLGFLFSQFVGPLPNTFKEWATHVEKAFPCLFDTKVLSCEAGDYGKTELSQMF